MQNLKTLNLARRSFSFLRLLPLHRSLSATSVAEDNKDDLQNEVLVEGKASARAAILNRPSALNALTTNMGIRLKKLYDSWEDNSDIGFVMMKGSGRAFCAGGDVVALYHLINEGKLDACRDFFRNLYLFIYILGTYLKPHVAILNGITMGGGGGVSIPGTFRIATDKTIFSTPEVHIGFHPDAGASFYLSHLTGHVGEYLALTGERLNGVDMLAVGLATHFSLSARLSWIDERLAKLVTDDPSVIDSSLAQYGDIVYPDKNSIVHRLEIIDKCFGRETVEEITDALSVACSDSAGYNLSSTFMNSILQMFEEQNVTAASNLIADLAASSWDEQNQEEEAARSNQDWCKSALKKLKEASPLGLKVSLRSIREGRYQTLDECLVREYRMSVHGISKEFLPNFFEGVRARLVEKDLAPKWDPPTLKHVSNDMVDQYFSRLDEFDPELKLPTHLREAFI